MAIIMVAGIILNKGEAGTSNEDQEAKAGRSQIF